MAQKKSVAKKEVVSEKAEEIVEVNIDLLTPRVFYQLQKALQAEGVILIDLETGCNIDGQINSLEVGMIHPSSPKKVKHPFGFHSMIARVEVEYCPQTEIDATLVQFPEVLTPEEATPFMFKVFLDSDIDLWLELIAAITPQFVIEGPNGSLAPSVHFSITSLGVAGEDKEKMLELLRKKTQKYSNQDSDLGGAGGQLIYPNFDEDFEDD